LFAVVLLLITGAFLPMLNKQNQPIYQVRAAELAQAMLQEALARSYDENSDRTGKTDAGKYQYCGSIDPTNSTTESSVGNCSTTLGAESGETYTTFDDVDDFNFYCNSPITGSAFAQLQGLDTSLYENYSIKVCVENAPELLGLTVRNDVAKKVTVTVTTPAGEAIPFTSYRSNY
jgi:MSHA pilin protein MshD